MDWVFVYLLTLLWATGFLLGYGVGAFHNPLGGAKK